MLDVGAGGLRDPQPVQREQGDQCMLGRWAEPGGYQERAELVAVQGDGIGFVVHPRTADVSGGGMLEELCCDRVLVEPGDGGQPAGDGGAGPAPGFQLPGKACDVDAEDGEQGQGAGAAPAGELAQVQGIRFAGQAAESGQEPGEGEPFGVGEGGLDRGERGGWGGSGHGAPPGGAGTGKAGPGPVPAVKWKPNVSRLVRSRYSPTSECRTPGGPARNAPERCSYVCPGFFRFRFFGREAGNLLDCWVRTRQGWAQCHGLERFRVAGVSGAGSG